MIREGKEAGWLRLSIQALQPWAILNNVQLHNVKVGPSPSDDQRGAGVFATSDIRSDDNDLVQLMTIPRDLILSRERVDEHAKVDQDFRAILDSLGDFGRSPRTSILTFLLAQSTLTHPDRDDKHFVHSPFTSYIKLLPSELLPTFWTDVERELLHGTSLSPAITAKSSALYREFDTFRSLTSSIPWCAELWWSEPDGILSIDDWLQVDAMYRSRALEFPGIGDCMAPCIDMANHAAGADTAAIYQVDPSNGDAVLLLRAGKTLAPGQEVTITYGDAKGACEMLFSYGFLEHGMSSARELFLDLEMAEDDPLAKAKRATANCAPGFKIVDLFCSGKDLNDDDDGVDDVRVEGDYVWFICVNEEDGLEFMIQRTTDGDEELKAFFGERDISTAGPDGLRGLLAAHSMWDVFRLRAVSVLQDRVAEQLRALYGSEDETASASFGPGTEARERVRDAALTLRKLEGELLEKAYAQFERQKEALMQSPVVERYLAAMDPGSSAAAVAHADDRDTDGMHDDSEDDFS